MPDSTVAIVVQAWAVLLLGFFALWLVSLPLRNASLVDIWWGPAFVLAAVVYAAGGGWPPRAGLVLALVAVWALRLAAHIALRNAGHGEDPRYRAWREAHGARWWWRSLLQVFVLQATIAWIVSWPLAAAMLRPGPPAPSMLDVVGAALASAGIAVEAIADWQLRHFKQDPANRGRVMDRGLWRYSRHPNYFGEAVVWWGLWVIAAGVDGGWATVVSPVLMTFLLLRVSGVTLLEKSLEARPGYAEYVRRTSAFVPRPPRA